MQQNQENIGFQHETNMPRIRELGQGANADSYGRRGKGESWGSERVFLRYCQHANHSNVSHCDKYVLIREEFV